MAEPADLIITGARLFRPGAEPAAGPEPSALAVRGDRIVAIDACVYPGGVVSPPKRAPLVIVLVVSSPPTNGAGRSFRTR